MTINRDWIVAFKQAHGNCFSRQRPGTFDCVFIDGQIKLMKGSHITTWKAYVDHQFAWGVRRHFENGAHTVVVAFDDYTYVPTAKGMTQAKRRKLLPPVDEHEATPLPVHIPDNWDAAIMNRVFKGKVIRLVCETLPAMIQLAKHQRLVIDYMGHPVVYTTAGAVVDPSLAPMGEADVKFTRYARIGRMLVEATDGDYVPIALMHLEHEAHRASSQGDESEQPSKAIHDIVIYRMECKLAPAKSAKPANSDASARRISYEYVSIGRLYQDLCHRFASIHGAGQRSRAAQDCVGHEMRLLAALIALTGCDFTKGLPQISPRRVWDLLPCLWSKIASCYDTDTCTINARALADLVVARLYAHAYPKHVPRAGLSMPEVEDCLKRKSGLSQTIKDRIPTDYTVLCSAQNSNWVVQYWTCPADGAYPDPLEGPYGFARTRKGLPCWADDLD